MFENNSRILVVVVVIAVTGKPVSVVSAHYDSRFAWLLLIQQSRPALKLLNVSELTTSLGKLFNRLDYRLRKKFSQ
jgi:hypothetical protein